MAGSLREPKEPERRNTLARAFRCAFQGIGHAFVEGRNFKIECCFGLAAIVLGIVLRIDAPSWLAVVICIGLVLSGECANTALEALVDLVSPEYHELARIAKDCAAGAVLVVSLASLAVGVILFALPLARLVFAA